MSSAAELVPDLIRDFRRPTPGSGGIPGVYGPRPLQPLGPSVQIDVDETPSLDLLSALQRRRSCRFYGPESLPAAGLGYALVRAMTADSQSWPGEQERCPLEIFTLAFRVGGLDPGMFQFDPRGRCYVPVAALPPPDQLSELTLQAEFSRSAAIVSIAGNLTATTALHGGHGYRLLMSRASAAAYSIWLDSVAKGWVGSVFAGILPASVRRPLLSDGNSRQQLVAFAVGAAPSQTGAEPAGSSVSHSGMKEEEKGEVNG